MDMVQVHQSRSRRPKVKGCYECSQRRINCDRSGPSCQKCNRKGISCSGLGVRYRFNHGVASRGKLVGKNITGENQEKFSSAPKSSSKEDDVLVFEQDCVRSSGLLDSLSSYNRYLVNYFGEHIAPAMVAVDDESNGYRAIILPAVEWHPSVLNAVLASSTYHIALRLGSQNEALQHAQNFYTQAINELVQLSFDINTDSTQTSHILTTLAMLVCAMITGSYDFPILLKMLESSIEASTTREKRGEFPHGSFLELQMRKFELYAGPFLDQKAALERFRSTESIDRGLSCLLQCSQLHPEHSLVLQRASSLIRLACLVYSLRARNDLGPDMSHELVEQYRNIISQYHPDSPGWKILIWPTFIVAAESTNYAHRLFFTSVFHEFFKKTGFGNLHIALNILQTIWQDGTKENWAEALPQWKSFIM